MARYSEEVVAQLKAHADITQVVQRFIPLRQQGKSWIGICPFHDDRKPSLHVTPSMGIYKCFACGAGGDVFKFVMEHEKIDFNAAVELVAQETGFVLPARGVEDKAAMEDRAVVLALNELAGQWFAEQYRHAPVAQEYVRKRGLTPETCERFGIGWAPDHWEGLVGHAAGKGFSPKQLVLAGLANEKDAGGVIDKFRGRLMIAIQNLSGKTVAFGGRILVDGTNAPKYMNSPETPLYHKSDILFGLNHARQAIEKSHEVVVVEGYFDLISLYQAGIQNVVAVSGTALTPQHARLLARYAKRTYLVFDGDGPGRKAARRSLETLVPVGMELRVLVLPDEDDPDELVREKGPDAFRELLQNRSRDFMEHLQSEMPLGTPEERTAFLNEIRRLISGITDPILRKEYLDLAVRRYPVDRRLLAQPVAFPKMSKHLAFSPDTPPPLPVPIPISPLEQRFLQLLLHNPDLWKALHAWFDPNLFESQPLVETLDQGLAILEDKGELDMTQFTEMLDEGIRNLVLLLREENWSPEAAQTEFLQTFAQIAIFRIQRARQSMQMQHPGTDAGLTQQTSLRLEANRLIRQLEIVRAKAGVEGQLSSASLLWNGLLEQIPQFLQKAMEKLD